MIIKIIGALFVIVACGSVGFYMAAEHRRTEKTLKQLLSAIDYIGNELQYRMSTLPDIFRQVATLYQGVIGKFFKLLTIEMEKQVLPNMICCVDAVIPQITDMPKPVKECLVLLGRSLGQFDVDGQLKDLSNVREECSTRLMKFTDNQEVRLRSYQTLALCAGAAVAILLM